MSDLKPNLGKLAMAKCETYVGNKIIGLGKLFLILDEDPNYFFLFVDNQKHQVAKNYWYPVNPEKTLTKDDKVCFTGTLHYTRDFYAKLVTVHGGEFQTGITQKTKYLVMANKNSLSSKAIKAREAGITLMDEYEFFTKLIKGNK